MSVYIKGMEMPKTCFLCKLSYMTGERLFCYLTKEEVLRGKIAPECPIIPVPDHGRLIDADALDYISVSIDKRGCISKIDGPTIIPADKEGE